MADQEVKIKVTATGGKAAAKEIGEVTKATTSQEKQTKALEKSQNAVSRSSVTMRAGMNAVGQSARSFTTSIVSGTTATTALAQTAPMLLSALGPVGIVLGVAAAAGSAVAAAFKDAGEEAEQSTEGIDKLTESLQKTAATRAAADMTQWLNSLDDEEAAISRINAQLESQVRILKAKLDAQAQIAEAEREAEKARIDADPTLDAEAKIIAKAALDQSSARASAEGQMQGLSMEVASRDRIAKQKEDEAKRAEDDLAAMREERERAAAEAARARAQLSKSTLAPGSLPGAQAQVKKSRRRQVWNAVLGRFETAEEDQAAVDAAERQQEGIQFEIDQTPRRQRDAAGASAALSTVEARIAKQEAAAAAAREEAEAARREANTRRAEAEEAARAITGTLAAGTTQRGITTGAAVAAARKKAQDEAAKQAAEQRRKALEDQAAAARSSLNAAAREPGLRIARAGQRDGDSALRSIGRALADGTDAAELQRIGDQIDLKQKELGQANVKALQKLLAELQAQAAKITALEGQIKTSRITR